MRPYWFLVLGAACGAPSPATAPGPATAVQLSIPVGLDRYRPVPADNPLTLAKVGLGRRLFFEKRLSADRSHACATCHDPAQAFSDGRTTSVGSFGRRGIRNVPTLVNRAWGKSFFWDGRTRTLEEQVLEPIRDSLEMALTLEEAVDRLGRDGYYSAAFRRVFGREASVPDLARALASYVRSIQSGDAPFDRYERGGRQALALDARAGLALFRGKAGCSTCHIGPNLTDEQFHNTGVAWRDGAPVDSGRFRVTGRAHDIGAFKTPTLREVARTAPYMHDGSFATLTDVIDFYDRGGRFNPQLDAHIHPLHLTSREKASLLAFLQSLTGRLSEGVPQRSGRRQSP